MVFLLSHFACLYHSLLTKVTQQLETFDYYPKKHYLMAKWSGVINSWVAAFMSALWCNKFYKYKVDTAQAADQLIIWEPSEEDQVPKNHISLINSWYKKILAYGRGVCSNSCCSLSSLDQLPAIKRSILSSPFKEVRNIKALTKSALVADPNASLIPRQHHQPTDTSTKKTCTGTPHFSSHCQVLCPQRREPGDTNVYIT